MGKLKHVLAYEFRREAFTLKFLIISLVIPLMTALTILLVSIIASSENKNLPVGYVDRSGFLEGAIEQPARGGTPANPVTGRLVTFLPYESLEGARKALEDGTIQAFYVITPGYLQDKKVICYYLKHPGWNVKNQFKDFMQINHLRHLPVETARRAVSDCNLIVRWPENAFGLTREFSAAGFLNQFVPFFIAVSFMFLLFAGSGYLMKAVAEEKENRTIEILATSLSPGKLIGGKILSAVCLTLTHYFILISFTVAVVLVGGYVFDIELLKRLGLDWGVIIPMVLLILPAFVMMAGLMTTVGVMVTESQEGQQMSMLFLMPVMIPIWLSFVFIRHPDSFWVYAMSFFPLTAPSALSIRMAFTRVPIWQLSLAIGVVTLAALGSVWVAGRAFRIGMLRYGKRLSLVQILKGRRT